METLDWKKDLKHLYAPSAKVPELVEIPAMHAVMVDGAGDPNGSKDFQDAVEALFSLSYTIKFMLKKRGGPVYAVMPLEGLWWADNPKVFARGDRDEWRWTLLIGQPDFVTGEDFREAADELARKKNPPALPKVRYELIREGRAAQIMHIGPFSAEGPTVARLHAFIGESGLHPDGKHHEIYLSDFRRTAPEKLRTIIRQPAR